MKNQLNIAGKLANYFYNSKLTILIVITILFAGLATVLIMPRMYNPEIRVPAANIIIIRPNTSALEMENQIVKPLEGIVEGINGVDHVFSYAIDSMAVTTVQFKVGENQDISMIRLYNRIMRNYDKMPTGTYQPIIKSIGVEDIPIITIALSSKKLAPYQLRSVANKLLNQIRGIKGVGTTTIIGGPPETIEVYLNPQKIASYNLSINRIVNYLKATGIFIKAGKITQNNQTKEIYVENLLKTKRDLENVIVGINDKTPIFLRNIATIKTNANDVNYSNLFAFGKASKEKNINDPMNAVTITIAKKRGTNAVFVAERVLKQIKYLKQTMLPEGINLTIMRNYAEKANRAVNELIEHLLVAILAVGVILLFFLGWKEALSVAIMVPLVLLLTIIIGFFIGETINRITLFALILSLGLLVDSGIVVIENIHRHLHNKDESLKEKIIFATNEIGNPTNIATVAVIIAFIPMAFVGGMMGPFMRPIPINVPIAMVASLILAYALIPFLARIIYKHKKEKERETKSILQKIYRKTLIPLMRKKFLRGTVYVVVLIALILSVMIPLWQFIRPQGINGPLSPFGVSFKMLPNSNVNTFLVEVKLPLNTPLEKTQSVAEDVAKLIGDNPYVINYQIYTGCMAPLDFGLLMRSFLASNMPNKAQIRVNIVKENRPKTHKIIIALNKALQQLRKQHPDAVIKIIEAPPGPPTRANVLAQLYGPNYSTLKQTAFIIKRYFKHVYGITNIDTSVYKPQQKIVLKVKYLKAILSGITPYSIANLLHGLLNGKQAGWLYQPNSSEPIYIILRLPKTFRSSINDILNLYIENPQGKQIPLRELVDVVKSEQSQPIYSRDQHRVVYVMGDMLKSSPVYAVLYLNKLLDNKTLPNEVKIETSNLGLFKSIPKDINSYTLRWGGDMRLTLDVFRDLGFAFIAALIFIYFLLVGYYKSFFIPIIVMGPIPLTIIGIFPGHWLFKQPFTATSMIGVIALAGIVIRNSLLLIDFIRDYTSKGYALTYAIIESGAVRFRPILLTALAIIFGSSVMISDPIFGGLALSLIFGTLASTMLSLILIPLLYYSFRKIVYK
ncbi:efflux RND transporter permease subunit [Hippea jasoniae]|uniref:efflux RND transporter permease subunit n=1 Tax=Hippea jasoniae TaxID=944479 RepID=UPI00054FD0DC|nr:efflux RND transporter permease subunit [Hippea jasoniae]